MQKVLKKSIHFTVGAGCGTAMALKADDMIYSQFKRHVISPFQVLVNANSISKEDLMELGAGTKTMMKQFQPHALQKVSAKTLLLDDNDYSTPQDHYFSYLT